MPATTPARLPSTSAYKDPVRFHDRSNLLTHLYFAEEHTADELELLRSIQDKLHPSPLDYEDYFVKRDSAKSYAESATLIALSTYDRRTDVVHCGRLRGPYRFRCNDFLVCPRCAVLKSWQLRQEFESAFVGNGSVYYIVASLSPNQDHTQRFIFTDFAGTNTPDHVGGNLVPPCPPEGFGIGFDTQAHIQDCRLYWKFYADAVKKAARGTSPIWGSIRVPELAVQLRPLRALPHANFIVWGELCEDDLRAIRATVKDKIHDSSRLETRLHPSLACYRLRSPDDLRRVLSYSVKAIDLAEAYLMAADRVARDPREMHLLNQEVNTFLTDLPRAFCGTKRVQCSGGCHASHHSYFGTESEWLREKRERARLNRKTQRQGPVNGTSEEPDWDSWGVRRPRFLSWLAWHQPFPRPVPPRQG